MSLDAVEIFVKVVQAGSFSAAARALGVPKSTVSLRIAQLEERLGVTLLTRTSRALHTTSAGAAYFGVASRALDEIRAAEASAAHEREEPMGLLRVAAPGTGGGFVGDLVAGFLALHPEVEIALRLGDLQVDLNGGNTDVALRFGPIKDDLAIVARRIGTSHHYLFASPSYLAGRPPVRRPEDLLQHACIALQLQPLPHETQHTRLELRGPSTTRARLKVPLRFASNQFSAVQHQAVAGVGIASLPAAHVKDELARGELVPVLPGWRSATNPIHVVYAKQKFAPARVRAFVAYVVLTGKHMLDDSLRGR